MRDRTHFLPSTHDDTDRTPDIQQMLEQHGACQLGAGL